jgi:RimJ/RimL family protein N-acetyltransferase
VPGPSRFLGCRDGSRERRRYARDLPQREGGREAARACSVSAVLGFRDRRPAPERKDSFAEAESRDAMSDQLFTTVDLRDGRTATLGQVTEHDASAMLAYLEVIANETDFLTFGPGEFGMTLDQEVAFLKTLTDPSNGIMLKAVVAGEIVGNAMLSRSPRPRLHHVAELGLSVRRNSWGRGIGSALCRTILSEAKRAGLTRIALRVRADNSRAIQLYERLGFAHEGRLVGAFLVGGVEFDELVMGLRI